MINSLTAHNCDSWQTSFRNIRKSLIKALPNKTQINRVGYTFASVHLLFTLKGQPGKNKNCDSLIHLAIK